MSSDNGVNEDAYHSQIEIGQMIIDPDPGGLAFSKVKGRPWRRTIEDDRVPLSTIGCYIFRSCIKGIFRLP
jgi:hypothetical protein